MAWGVLVQWHSNVMALGVPMQWCYNETVQMELKKGTQLLQEPLG
jgi:hypothetical protein